MTRYFRFTEGGVVWPERKVSDGESLHTKQVVVIDFNDRKQVERLGPLHHGDPHNLSDCIAGSPKRLPSRDSMK